MTALALDPVRPATLYVGTAFGLYRTRDAGQTWTASNTGLKGEDILALAADPQTEGTVYVGTVGHGVFKSTDGADNWSPTGLGGTTSVECLAIDPATPATLYAGTKDGPQRSDDGGATWTKVALVASIQTLAIDPVTPTTVYAGLKSGGIFKSTDRGASWLPASGGLTLPSVAAIAIDPTQPATLYAGTASGVLASNNGAASWTPANTGFPTDGTGSGTNVTTLVLDPLTGAVAYAGTDGDAVFRSGTPTSTPTLPGTGSTTSTTLPGESTCASGCDDGDPCTVDTCVRGTCQHDPATGVAAATCALELTGAATTACGNGALPPPIAHRLDKALSLIDKAVLTSPRRGKELALRAVQSLRSARHLALAAERRKRITEACATALVRQLTDALARAQAFAKTL
jgi:hypothetical protein